MVDKNVVIAENLVKKFEYITAVDSISFKVNEGEIFGLLGPNGAGKTTTVRMLCAIIPPTSGQAVVLGNDVSDNPIGIKSNIGLLPETPSVYESLTAEENLHFFAEMYEVPVAERESRIDQLLADFGLESRRSSKVETFSKGMKQKLALARTLIHDPPLVFLDEPTSGLDPESARMVRDTISEMSEEEKTTIFLCTHNLPEAEELCSRVAIIKSGKIIRIGSPQELGGDHGNKGIYRLRMESITEKLMETLKDMDFIGPVTEEDSSISLEIQDPDRNAPELVEKVVKAGGRIMEFRRETRTLEDIYLEAVKG